MVIERLVLASIVQNEMKDHGHLESIYTWLDTLS